MKTLWLVLILSTLLTCCVSPKENASSRTGFPAPENPSPPAGWNLIKECGAEFYVPPGFKEKKIKGIDSCVKQYRGESTLMSLDVLAYITPDASRRSEYSEKRDFEYKKTNVGGRRAEIITCYETDPGREAEGLNYAAVLFVPQMREDGGNLTIWTYSKSPEERAEAIKIF